MSKAKNKVIAGDFNGSLVMLTFDTVYFSSGFSKPMTIDSKCVETYEIVTDEHRRDVKSGISRGLMGAILLAPIGGALIGGAAGVFSAKQKGIYQIAIQFKDGKKSLIEIDDKIYKAIIKNCF